jgi:GH15 family glucan-1,4-alpha-glucosidase
MELRIDGFAPIESYAAISDQRTVALVCADGAIDWLCAPRFDHPPMASRLLAGGDGGVFELHPVEPFESERRYVEDTNVLETTWKTASGTVRITDALVVTERIQRFSQLLRRVECTSGSVALTWRVRPRFGWGLRPPRHAAHEAGHMLADGDLELLVQSFDLGEAEYTAGEVRASVTLEDGDTGLLSVLFAHSFPLLASKRDECERRLDETLHFWRGWLAPLAYDGHWKEAVRRSALAVGSCVHDETGAMVAAPTTSLPERLGGDRNYDYRYCWVRDTSFALDAALRLGLGEFAQATLGWLLRSERRTHPRLNVFFTLDGEPFREEDDVALRGYRGALPVRVGNAAGHQLQLGCYGDLMETAWLFVDSGSRLDDESGLHLAEVADHVCRIWHNRDSGIWELDDQRDYTLSKVLCWAALDRALKLADSGQLHGGHTQSWQSARGEIAGWVREHCIDDDGVWCRDGNGSGELDCSVLLAPRCGLIERGDSGYSRTIDRIRSELGAGGPLLYRYSSIIGEEGAFVACSFWMAEALARMDRVDEAVELMDELVGLTNDVGLLSEEIDPSSGAFLGNFPQVLSHLALLNAAAVIEENAGAA